MLNFQLSVFLRPSKPETNLGVLCVSHFRAREPAPEPTKFPRTLTPTEDISPHDDFVRYKANELYQQWRSAIRTSQPPPPPPISPSSHSERFSALPLYQADSSAFSTLVKENCVLTFTTHKNEPASLSRVTTVRERRMRLTSRHRGSIPASGHRVQQDGWSRPSCPSFHSPRRGRSEAENNARERWSILVRYRCSRCITRPWQEENGTRTTRAVNLQCGLRRCGGGASW